MITENEIKECLAEVVHPAKDKSIVDLGMVQNIETRADGAEVKISVTLAFSKHRDPLSQYLIDAARAAIIRKVGKGTDVLIKTVVREDKPAHKGLELGNEELEKVHHIIAVSSGKGGVGKSTVAVNLAIALARLGYSVGLADADVYGPSVPKMTGTEGVTPEGIHVEDDNGGRDLILPVEKYGVKWMSIGYFASKEQALIWRGPMACNALKQMILQVRWGELDFLLIDMPPGTGDIHISLVHDIPLSGTIIVSTPQDVALADVEKGVNMFRNPNVNKKIYGLVENMAWFTPAEHPDEKYYIFGKDGGSAIAARYSIPLLGRIPLVQSIREGGDEGKPAALSLDRPDSAAFLEIAEELSEEICSEE